MFFFFFGDLYIGYGILDECPALYGLWWNSASLLNVGSNIKNNLTGKPTVWMLKNGFYSIWQKIVEKEKLNIKYQCDIIKIDRYCNDPDKCTTIKYKDLKTNKEEIMECDVLFTAVDLSTFLPYFDAQKDEQEIFSSLKAYTLVASLYENDIEFDDNGKPKRGLFKGILTYIPFLLFLCIVFLVLNVRYIIIC